MENPQLSILVIDEDQPSRNYLGALLARQNHSVQVASSGKEGYISALRDKPEIIIFDTNLTDISALELVRKLCNDKRSAATIFIALASVLKSTQKEDLLAAGCSWFFIKNQDSIEKLLSLLASPEELRETGMLNKRSLGGLLGVFLSAKGGQGTSSLCANIAQNIASTFPELGIAVMDLVLPIGSISSIVGQQGTFDMSTAVSLSQANLQGDVLRRALAPLENWQFHFLAGSPDPETSNLLDTSRFPQVARALRQAFDFTAIDLGCSLSSENLAIIKEADVVVMVTNTDLSTVKMAQTTWKYLQNKGVQAQRMYTIINRSMGMDGLGKSDAEGILGLDIRATFPYLDGTLPLANNQHLPIQAKLPDDTTSRLIKLISREIIEIARRNHA